MKKQPAFARAYPNFASASLGADVTAVSDDFFASAKRLLVDKPPVFIADKYDSRGKWMDGWESRRSRDKNANDWCIVRLASTTTPRGVLIDTAHFNGNQPQAASLDFCPDLTEDMYRATTAHWLPMMDKKKLKANAQHYFGADKFTLAPHNIRYLRFNIFPNGGVARLRVYGEASGDAPVNAKGDDEVSSLLCGGRVVDWNNSHFGEPWVVLKPDRAKSMQDGWETRRRRAGDFGDADWILIHLPRPAVIRRVEVDTGYFKGNFPESCSIEAGMKAVPPDKWKTLLPQTKLAADKRHFFDNEVCDLPPVEMARLRIYPDGGVSRLRLFGEFAK